MSTDDNPGYWTEDRTDVVWKEEAEAAEAARASGVEAGGEAVWKEEAEAEEAREAREAAEAKRAKWVEKQIGYKIAEHSGYSEDKGIMYGYNQAEALANLLPLHEEPFVNPTLRSEIHGYDPDNAKKIIEWERDRRQKSYKKSTKFQEEFLDAKRKGDLHLQKQILRERVWQVAEAEAAEAARTAEAEAEAAEAARAGMSDVIKEWERKRLGEAERQANTQVGPLNDLIHEIESTMRFRRAASAGAGGFAGLLGIYIFASIENGDFEPWHWPLR